MRGEAMVNREKQMTQRIGPNDEAFCHDCIESITSTSTVSLSTSTASLSTSNTNLADGKS